MSRAIWAEGIGTAGLVTASVASAIMGMNLASGNMGVALLGNSISVALALYVLITVLGPISGAHLNPAVTLYFLIRREIGLPMALRYFGAQVIGTFVAVALTHAMFDLPLFQLGTTSRTGDGQWLSEATATMGLLLTIIGGRRYAPAQVPALVAAWVGAAFWFTSSTCFANPAVTLARMFSDTFSGILPADAPGFMAAQFCAAILSAFFLPRLFKE